VIDPAAPAELRERLERHDAIVGVVGDMRNLTGPLGAQPHVIRL
jgi:hypothetical protein